MRKAGRLTLSRLVVLVFAAWFLRAAPVPAVEVTFSALVPLPQLSINAAQGVAVDGAGNVWVTGFTTSHDLPITDDAIDDQFAAPDNDEAFVLKFDSSGELVYATYLGGTLQDDAASIALDSDGNVFVAGTTNSTDFPVSDNAFQASNAGFRDAFLVKLDNAGQLVASTYFGGSSDDVYPGGSRGNPGAAVAVAGDGTVYLAGGTNSNDLLTGLGEQPGYGGGSQDAYLARFDNDLHFQRCTYLGGRGNDGAFRVALDGSDNVFLLGVATVVLGDTWTFPVTPGTYLSDPQSDRRDPLLFVAKYSPAGDKLYATFLGPQSGDGFFLQFNGDLAVDAAGNAYVTGVSLAPDFPVTPSAYQKTPRGFGDFFVSKLDPSGSSLVYSTLLGGSQAEQPSSIPGVRVAVGADGSAYVTGESFSTDFPAQDPLPGAATGGPVAVKLAPDGSSLVYSTGIPVGATAVMTAAANGARAASVPAVYLAGVNVASPGLAVIGIDESVRPCAGDCNSDGVTRVNELILGVRIALGQAALDACASFDDDGNGSVSIAELVRGVRSALNGC